MPNTILQGAEISGQPSYDDLRLMIQKALDGYAGGRAWITELSSGHVIVCRNDDGSMGGKYFRYPYTVEGDQAKLGDPVPVKLAWEDRPVQAADPQLGCVFSEDGTRAFFVTELAGEQFAEAAAAPDADGKVRRWVQICRDGVWSHPKFGKVEVNQAFRDKLVANFNGNVRRTEIPTDYDHKTDGPASGWYRKLENRGNALFAEIEFTPTAVNRVKAGEYRYFSPEWDRNYSDNETGKAHGPTLLGGGLVNRPFFRGMQSLQFSEPGADAPQEKVMPEIIQGKDTPTAEQFAELQGRIQAQEKEIAAFRAAEEKRSLTETFSEMKFGEGQRQTLAPASRTALTDALLDVPADKREKVIAAVKGLTFAELGEVGFQAGEPNDPEKPDADEVKRLAAMTPTGQAGLAAKQ